MRRREVLLAMGAWLCLGGVAKAQPCARRLILTNPHTGETFNGCYRDAQGPIPGAMSDLRELLRDFHTNTLGPLDVSLIDLLADVMEASGQSRATILSGFRTAQTNARLAATMFGVAEKSQHLLGRAVDVGLPYRLADAAKQARAMGRGGVGWYPEAHFVHLDTGPVRHWEFRPALASNHGHNHNHGKTVADRHAIHQALAHHDFLARR